MKYLLVPVIMVLATGGTIGILKLIKKLFPGSQKIVDKTNEWVEKHK